MLTFYQRLQEQKTSGSFKSLLPDNYWNDKRLKQLEDAYNAGLSRKEMVKKYFPEANPRHIETALAKNKDRLNLTAKISKNPTATREFNEYWSPDKKHLLRRAWRSGLDLPTIHSTHFDDIPYQRLRKNVRMLRGELGLKPRNIRHVQPEKLVSSVEKRDHGPILDDLKKGRSIDRVAKDHYADPTAIRQLRTRELGPLEKYSTERPYEITPSHHIEYANEIAKKHPRLIDPTVKAKSVGPRLIARALNNKFGHEEGFIPYNRNHIEHMLNSGMIQSPGRRKTSIVSEKGTANRARRQSIWTAHQRGDDASKIASDHNLTISRINQIIRNIGRKQKFAKPQNINITDNKNKEPGSMSNLTERVVRMVMEAKEEEFDTPQQRAMRRETQHYKKLHKDLMRVRKMMNIHLMRLDPTSPVAKIAKRYHKMASDDAENIYPTPKKDKSETIKEAMALARKKIEEAKDKPEIPPTGTGSKPIMSNRASAIVAKLPGGKKETVMTSTRGKGQSSGRGKEGRETAKRMGLPVSAYKRPGTFKD